MYLMGNMKDDAKANAELLEKILDDDSKDPDFMEKELIEQAEYFAEEAKKLDYPAPSKVGPVIPMRKPKTPKQLKARAKSKRARKARKINRR